MIYCNHVGAEVGASSLLLIFFFYLNFHTFFHHVLHVVNILFRYILKTFVEISNFHKFFFWGGGWNGDGVFAGKKEWSVPRWIPS